MPTKDTLIQQYCRDWQKTDKPWERWESRSMEGAPWKPLSTHPSWFPDHEYRRKQTKIKINDTEYNAPLSEAPKLGTQYWNAYIQAGIPLTWSDDDFDREMLENGLVFATKEDAEAVWRAITAPLRASINNTARE